MWCNQGPFSHVAGPCLFSSLQAGRKVCGWRVQQACRAQLTFTWHCICRAADASVGDRLTFPEALPEALPLRICRIAVNPA